MYFLKIATIVFNLNQTPIKKCLCGNKTLSTSSVIMEHLHQTPAVALSMD